MTRSTIVSPKLSEPRVVAPLALRRRTGYGVERITTAVTTCASTAPSMGLLPLAMLPTSKVRSQRSEESITAIRRLW